MTKEEVIQQAWGDKWQFVKSLTPNRKDSNDAFDLYELGFFNTKRLKLSCGSVLDYFPTDKFDHDGKYVTPTALRGLKTNNGWTKIENISDLPKVSGAKYKVVLADGSMEETDINYSLREVYNLWKITHYKEIKKDLPPLY